MTTSIFKKAAAALCGVTTLLALGATALSASAAEAIEFSADKVTVEADQAGKEVPFNLYIKNNSGYAAAGVSLTYDQACNGRYLTGVAGKTATQGKFDKGPGCSDLTIYCPLNAEKRIFGYSAMGTEVNTENGIVITAYFMLPADAEPGDVYPITVEVNQVADADANLLESTTVDGYIEVKEQTTTTTTTTTSETTTTTTTTESTTGESVTTEDTTTAAPPIQTGDASAAIAVAGLVAVAGAAFVLRKKED